MKRGTLISIDGIDGVGKNTQAIMLKDAIVRDSGECGFFSFPRYNTPTGALVGDYLRSEMNHLTMFERAKLYSDDRLAARSEIMDYLDRGVDVVCDRYVDSNTAFFSSFERISPELFEDFVPDGIAKALEDLEYGEYKLPETNATFILVLPTALATVMVEKKMTREYTSEKKDLHERNMILLQYALEYYASLPNKHPRYQRIDCSSGDGVQTPEEIHTTLFQQYQKVKQDIQRYG